MASDPRSRRAILESMKYLTASEVLFSASVSRFWSLLSKENEIWDNLLGSSASQHRSSPVSRQDIYKSIHHKVTYVIKLNRVCKYVIRREKWVVTPLNIDWFVHPETATVLIPSKHLFLVPPLYDYKENYGNYNPSLVTIDSGNAEILPALSPPRQHPGLCLYDGSVYAFCGSRLVKCERFCIEEKRWMPLPDSLEPRQAFNPVIHSSLIYLPNGHSESTEVFNPVTTTFTLLEPVTGMFNSATSVSLDNRLIILGLAAMVEIDIDTKSPRKMTLSKSIRSAWSTYNPVVCGEEIVLAWPYMGMWSLACFNISTQTMRFVDMPGEE